MEVLLQIVQGILSVGAVVMLPIMICILGVVFRMGFGASLRAGIQIGIGFQGLSLTVGLLMTIIKPVIDYYNTMGTGFTTVDIGWAALGAAAWSVPFAPLAVPLIVVVNLIMLRTKLTKVMNVDMWNYIHFLIPGALAYALWGSAALGLAITVGLSIISLIAAQIVAPKWQSYFGLEGTTCSTFSFITFMYPLSIIINKIIDHIPALNKIDVDMKYLNSKLGVFGDPAFIGAVIGIFLGIITKQTLPICLVIGMGLASVLILIPRMVSIMMEGLTPIGNAANEWVKKKLGEDADLWIGMDVALGLGDPACITCTAICIPLTILFAFIIPDMKYFPVGLLTVVCYVTIMCVLASKGNLFRSLMCSSISMLIVSYCANVFSPETTAMLGVTGLKVNGLVADGFWGFNIADIILSLIHRL